MIRILALVTTALLLFLPACGTGAADRSQDGGVVLDGPGGEVQPAPRADGSASGSTSGSTSGSAANAAGAESQVNQSMNESPEKSSAAGDAEPAPQNPAPQNPAPENVKQSYNELTAEEARVILNKGTEWRGTGEYTDLDKKGTYICRQCNSALYTSDQKFHSSCGWPAFDDEIDGRVDRVPDADGMRTEIVCNNCKGHLGHVFLGEGFTPKDTRHCVNSISMIFVPAGKPLPAPIVLDKQ